VVVVVVAPPQLLVLLVLPPLVMARVGLLQLQLGQQPRR
jgi:hypothetical protein